MASTAGPQDVLDAVRFAREALGSLPSPGVARGSRDEWVAVVGALQELVNQATAVQEQAIVALAAVDSDWAEDGTVVEVVRAPGHLALDAPALVSGVLKVSAVHAERRVRDAVRRVADGPEGSLVCTGLGGLHAAMRAGRLDGYRARVVAEQLEEVPAPVAATVVASVSEWFDSEDGPHLRRRVRRMLAVISPDLVRQRAVRAREASGLQRWVDEPGVDTWLGTFPSEEACTAWAAIDALAQQYVTDGVCERIDRARAKALTDLVTGSATIDLQVVLTTPAVAPAPAVELPPGLAGDLVAVGTARAGDPILVQRHWLARAVTATAVTGRDRTGGVRALPCDTTTGAPVDPDGDLTGTGYRPSARLAAFVRARDRHCRFPGCTVTARFCDVDHVRPFPAGPTSARNLACLCRRHHRVKQRPGWRATLHPDASMTWTDPTGRTRTTHPPDQLHPITLPDTGTDPPPPPPGNPSPVLPDAPHSTLEHHLEHRGEPAGAPAGCRVEIHRPLLRPGPHDPPEHHRRRAGRPCPAWPEHPPF